MLVTIDVVLFFGSALVASKFWTGSSVAGCAVFHFAEWVVGTRDTGACGTVTPMWLTTYSTGRCGRCGGLGFGTFRGCVLGGFVMLTVECKNKK